MKNKRPTTDAAKSMAAAIQSADPEAMESAWNETMEQIADSVRADFEACQAAGDAAALAQRGIRQLTAEESKFYEALKGALKAQKNGNPKEAFIELIGEDADADLMPSTIIEDVFKELEDEHRLLQLIDYTYTGYATKWLKNDHAAQKAKWGKIDEAITKEITSDIEVIQIDQNKLSAFCVIPLDILDMGYSFMDAYVRRVLKEALACGLEAGIISGNGIDCPKGLDRDIDPKKFNGETGAPQKEAIKVGSLDAANYLPLLSRLVKTEKGRKRTFNKVVMVVNQFDYLSKVAPATTFLTPEGTYAKDIFPFPTEVALSNEVEDGKAVIFVPKCYTFCVGGSRNDLIEFDDSYKFLDDARTFKVLTHGDGEADDNTAAIVIDLSELKPVVPKFELVGGGNAPAEEEPEEGEEGEKGEEGGNTPVA